MSAACNSPFCLCKTTTDERYVVSLFGVLAKWRFVLDSIRDGENMLRSIGLPELSVILFVGLLWLLCLVVPFWKIFSKAGYPGVMSLMMCVPILNVIMLFFLAFSDWPILRSKSRP